MKNSTNSVPSSNHIVKLLSHLCEESTLEKKKHYNAADRVKTYHYWLGIPSIALSVILGTTLIGLASEEWPDGIKWIGAILAAILTLLTSFQTFFNFEKKAESHRILAARFLSIKRECERNISYGKEGNITQGDLKDIFESLSQKYEQAIEDAISCPTKQKDYLKAKQGIEGGEEEYSV